MSAIFRLVLRTQFTKGRAAALGSVAIVGVLLAVAVRRLDSFTRPDHAYDLVQAYGLSLLVPLTSLVFAAAALGDPAEDGTLVYLWRRPLPRWQLALASFGAALCISVPFGVVPTALAAAVTGSGRGIVVGAALASSVAVVAYSGLFLALGLVVRRALIWGLAYVLIWEGFVARSGTGPARLSVLVYARSLLASRAGHKAPALSASMPVSLIVPLVVGLAAVALTAWLLRRLDVR
ncbi:MAG: type transport system permease protein [Actinomycetota bacterium]|nr:type transport system permease protein [Actinomycetota bacterium]